MTDQAIDHVVGFGRSIIFRFFLGKKEKNLLYRKRECGLNGREQSGFAGRDVAVSGSHSGEASVFVRYFRQPTARRPSTHRYYLFLLVSMTARITHTLIFTISTSESSG